ncbi:MAG: hypothetical protein WDN67_01945 [Candidatus Moraniibacteriota bacterium]
MKNSQINKDKDWSQKLSPEDFAAYQELQKEGQAAESAGAALLVGLKLAALERKTLKVELKSAPSMTQAMVLGLKLAALERKTWDKEADQAAQVLSEERKGRQQHVTRATLEDAMHHPAPIIEYADFSRDMLLECPICGWKGKAGDGDIDHYHDLMDVSCPECEKMLLVINYPLIDRSVI